MPDAGSGLTTGCARGAGADFPVSCKELALATEKAGTPGVYHEREAHSRPAVLSFMSRWSNDHSFCRNYRTRRDPRALARHVVRRDRAPAEYRLAVFRCGATAPPPSDRSRLPCRFDTAPPPA